MTKCNFYWVNLLLSQSRIDIPNAYILSFEQYVNKTCALLQMLEQRSMHYRPNVNGVDVVNEIGLYFKWSSADE